MAEDRYNQLLNSMDEGFCVIDVIFNDAGKPVDWRYLETNRQYINQGGIPAAAGQLISEICGGAQSFWFDFYGSIAVSGIPAHIENEFKEDGKWFDIYAFKIGGDESRKVGVLCRDISERRKTEEALRESERRFRSVLDNSVDCIYCINMQTDRFDYINPSCENIMGYTPAQFMSMSSAEVMTMIHPDDLPAVQAARTKLLETGNEEIIYRQRAANGEYRWLSNHISLTRDNAGRPLYRYGNIRDITEARRTEEALREGEQLFRTVHDNSLDRFTILKPFYDDEKGNIIDFTYIYQNTQAAKTAGRIPEEMIGHRMTDFFPTFPQTNFFAMYKKAAETRQPLEFEDEYHHDGVNEWFRVTVTPVSDGITTAAQNITERKRAEEALQQANRNFTSLFNNKTVGLYYCRTVFDEYNQASDFFVLDINPTYEIMTGISRSQIVGKNITESFPGVSQDFINRHNTVAVTGEESRFEYYEPVTARWYDINVFSPQRGYFIGVFFNITERKQTEEALQQANRNFTSLFNNKTVGLFYCRTVFDQNNQPSDYFVLDVNPTYEIMTGIPRNQIVGKKITEAVPGISQNIINLQNTVAVTGEETQIEIYEPCTARWYDINVFSPQRGYFIGVFFNITERKRTENALQKSEQKALALVEELEKADKNKNQFISILSHELRNPLAVITAGLSLLEAAKSNEQIAKTKKIIKRQTGQLTKLVDDLLDLTRMNQNKITLKNEWINLSDTVKNTALDHQSKYTEKDIILRTELPSEPVYLSADHIRITQCVGNLLQNALKFTPKTGEVVLSLETENGVAVIRVMDNGIGITPNLLAHIFEPFTQADTSLDRQNSGLGLGLPITKGITELHGGTAAAFSEGIGKGSLFTIRLPMTVRDAETQNPETMKNTGRTYKILLIDDNESLCDVLCSVFELIGHQAVAAHTGTNGIAEAKKTRPDIIFCDIGLPGLSGYEVAKILKADEELKSTFLIALTGYTGSEEIERTKAAGFDLHLAKPVDMALLSKILAEIK